MSIPYARPARGFHCSGVRPQTQIIMRNHDSDQVVEAGARPAVGTAGRMTHYHCRDAYRGYTAAVM